MIRVAVFHKGEFVDYWGNAKLDDEWLEITCRSQGWKPKDVEVKAFDIMDDERHYFVGTDLVILDMVEQDVSYDEIIEEAKEVDGVKIAPVVEPRSMKVISLREENPDKGRSVFKNRELIIKDRNVLLSPKDIREV